MGSETELSRREKRQAIEKALEQNLPALLLGFCISVSITLSLALIGIQIYSIVQKLDLYYIGKYLCASLLCYHKILIKGPESGSEA